MHISSSQIKSLLPSLFVLFALKPTITPTLNPSHAFERLSTCTRYIPRYTHCSPDGHEWNSYHECLADAGLRVEDNICVVNGILQHNLRDCETRAATTGLSYISTGQLGKSCMVGDGLQVEKRICFPDGTVRDSSTTEDENSKQPLIVFLRDLVLKRSISASQISRSKPTITRTEVVNMSMDIQSGKGSDDFIVAWQAQRHGNQTTVRSIKIKVDRMGDWVAESCYSGMTTKHLSSITDLSC